MKAFLQPFEHYPNVTEHQLGGGLWVVSHNSPPVTYICSENSPIYKYIRAVERAELKRLTSFYPDEEIGRTAMILAPLRMSDLDFVPPLSSEEVEEDEDTEAYEEDLLSDDNRSGDPDPSWDPSNAIADEPEPPPNKLELFLGSTADMIFNLFQTDTTPKEKNDKGDVERDVGTHVRQDTRTVANRNIHVSFQETEMETNVNMTTPQSKPLSFKEAPKKLLARNSTDGWWHITKPSIITCYKISAALNVQTVGFLGACHKNATAETNPQWLRSFYTSIEEYLTQGLEYSKTNEFMENLLVVLKFALTQDEDSGVREPASSVYETLISPLADVNRNLNK